MIEALSLRFMQSWMHRDASAIKSMAARDLMMMIGSNPPELLDRPSFVAAVERDFRCNRFRMGEAFIRRHGRTAWYVAGADLELQLGAHDWPGRFMITDMWQKQRFGGWKLVERSLAPTAADDRFADNVRKLQQWR